MDALDELQQQATRIGNIVMKRDMELIRKILQSIEEEPTGFAPNHIKIEGYSEDQINYHVYLMIDAGLLEGFKVTSHDSNSPEAKARNLTWFGHEFLDASRDNTRWEKAKTIVNFLGGVTLDVFIEILKKIMINQINPALTL
ncbi:MAG TPA: DUF2513 domain-containing protein [bacterium]|nr:DUF2513 domain-containing protein [bacterium]